MKRVTIIFVIAVIAFFVFISDLALASPNSNPPTLPAAPAWPTKSHRPLWRFSPFTPSPTPTPTIIVAKPSPTPRPIAQGSQTYTAGMGQVNDGPKMKKFIVDPHDPALGETQTVQVWIKDVTGVDMARVLVQTDTQSTMQQLYLVSGTELDGWWEGSWALTDTHNYNYVFTFEAASDSSVSSIDLTIR